ncbi:MAG: hypothetical protein PHF67_02580 [Candidatus Nanoarchaeia archaeon]|nr:hypothetical protein [Candidatus Nanoarchaeia archaeon]
MIIKKALFKKKTLEKKAQQEIAGFVIIVVLVSVGALLFFSLMLGRGESKLENNAEISYLLKASMYYTTNCAVNFIPQYQSLEDLTKLCYNNGRCINDVDSCRILNETFKGIIKDALLVSPNSPNKAYLLNIYYREENSTSPNEEILKSAEGQFKECGSKIGGVESRIYRNGNIEFELEVCKG